MHIEYEAAFTNINKKDIRSRLTNAGATLVRPEFMQKRVVFNVPSGHEVPGGWARVRDEGEKITMSFKVVDGADIHNQKEICLTVDNFENAVEFMESLGCEKKAFQESLRELWQLDGVDITIDEWPYLEPFVEIEGPSEEAVRTVSEKLGFDYTQAFFGAVGTLYERKYNIPEWQINNHTAEIVFNKPNPFIK